MKNIISILFVATILVSCNTQDSEEKTTPEPTENKSEKEEVSVKEESNVELKPIASKEAIISTALLAAPEASREECTVKGYNKDGEFVTLKEGSNEFICLADDPNQDGFSVACYHKSLEPFMARGRALKAEGKDGREVFKTREEEIKSGKLEMGEAGSTLHVYYGPKAVFNPNTNDVPDAKYRYVVYMPFATSESTGLPETPRAQNHPWIMDPGTHKAHIMISPLQED
jgi:hypothetical protein